jgi:hypothetical protein
MVARLHEPEKRMSRKSVQLIHEGKFAAEVSIELVEDETGWSPYILPADIEKIDRVRIALRKGDVVMAAKDARVFELLRR